MKKLFAIAILFLVVVTSFAQDTIRVMSYNLLNYGNVTSYCTTTNNPVLDKEAKFRTIVSYVQPDILGVNEMDGYNSAYSQRFLDSVMNNTGNPVYSRAAYVNQSSSDIINMLYFNHIKFTLVYQNTISSGIRDINLYKLRYNSPDVQTLQDTVYLWVIIAHLKAGSTASDQDQRAQETQALMDYIYGSGIQGNVLVMGDFNVQKSSETSFQNLINYTQSSVRFYDPVNKLGDWNENSAFADYHTQCSVLNSNGCAVGGGLDDRFDFILASFYVMQNIAKIGYVNGSYTTVGQDGNHFNSSVSNPANYSVPTDVLLALSSASDHLPLYFDLRINQTPAVGIEQNLVENGFIRFVNPAEGELNISLDLPVSGKAKISLTDISGRKMLSETILLTRGHNQTVIPAPFPKGIYIISIEVPEAGLSVFRKIVLN